MVWPTRRTRRQVRNNNDWTSVLFAAAFAHIEPPEEANDEVGGGGVAHVGVAGGSGGFGGGRVGDGGGGGGGSGGEVVGHGSVSHGIVTGGVVGSGAIGGGAIGGGAIGGGAIGGVGGGSDTNDFNNNNNNEANDYGNNNDDANDDANNNNNDANDILSGGGGMDGLEAELEQMIEGEAGNPSNHSSSIMIHSIRDGVVAPHTLKTYCTEILKFLNWCRENKHNWLQAVALLRLDEIQTRAPNECVCAFKARVQEALKVLL